MKGQHNQQPIETGQQEQQEQHRDRNGLNPMVGVGIAGVGVAVPYGQLLNLSGSSRIVTGYRFFSVSQVSDTHLPAQSGVDNTQEIRHV